MAKKKKHKERKPPTELSEGFVENVGETFYSLYFDGLCKPVNPGGIAIGSFLIIDEKGWCEKTGAEVVERENKEATNNTAEWAGLVLGLRALAGCAISRPIKIFGDSAVVLFDLPKRKISGSEHLQKWKIEAREILSKYIWGTNHLPREQNGEADRVGNELYDKIVQTDPFCQSRITDENHWLNQPASGKQIRLLRSLGCKISAGITKGEASRLIDEKLGRLAFA